MSMSDAELQAFARRVKAASNRGYSVAKGASYAALLMEETGLKGYSGSVADLDALCKAASEKRAGKAISAPSKAPPEPEPVFEDDYDAWTKDELYEEAKERDIEGRGSMTKDQLIEAIRASD